MRSVFEQLRLAWQSEDREASLTRAVERLAADGATRATLDEALGRLLDEVRSVGEDESAEEAIAGLGDRLHGWCHPSNAIDATTSPLVPAGR